MSAAVVKVERDGKVAVLVSPGFGAGWTTWNAEHREIMCFDADIVAAVEARDFSEAARIAESKCPSAYTGGARDLVVYWVRKGEAFEITEYDGNESLTVIGEQTYMVA